MKLRNPARNIAENVGNNNKKMRQSILIVFFSLSLTSCFNSKREPRNNVFRPEFDISNDNKNIVCSYYENDKAIVYQIDIRTNKKQRLTPTSIYSFIRPVFSPDSKQVACIAEPLTDNLKSKILLLDITTKALNELTNDSLLILECIFDPSGKSIYFSASKYYGNYSPIARKAPHEIDIYNVDINSKKVSQISNFNSYNLHGLSITNNGDSLLFNLVSKEKNGFFLMDIVSKKLVQIAAINDLRAEKKLTPYEYYSPVLSRDNSKIAFSEPYELYIMDRQTGISKLIFRNEPSLVNVGDFKFFYKYNYLMLTIPTISTNKNSSGDNFEFYTLNPETNEIKVLDL